MQSSRMHFWKTYSPCNPHLQRYLSSLQAIYALRTANPQIHGIKIQLRNLLHKTSLSHVIAHKGIFGDKFMNFLAKERTIKTSVNISLVRPTLISKTKFLKMHLMRLIKLAPSTLAFLTGHGPFGTYLNKF